MEPQAGAGQLDRGSPAASRKPFRRVIERGIVGAVTGCACISIVITFAIIVVLFEQSAGFFGLHGEDTPGEPQGPRGATAAGPRLSEVRTTTPGERAEAYIELEGPPGALLDGLGLIVVGAPAGASGDGSAAPDSGVVIASIALDGLSLNRKGVALVATDDRVFGVRAARVDARIRLVGERALTYVMVRGGRPAAGADLDADDDGSLDGPLGGEVVDSLVLRARAGDAVRQGHAYDVMAAGGGTPRIEGEAPPRHAFRDTVTGSWRLGTDDPSLVRLSEFLTGTEWNPKLGEVPHFGVLPLVTGTLLVTVVAMAVAIPGGLLTAIFLSEYAPRGLRSFLKPVLEVLAGVPTVVYGFFALTMITPLLRGASLAVTTWMFDAFATRVEHADGTVTEAVRLFGRTLLAEPTPVFESSNAFGAGIAVGIMSLPIVCSLSEDALQAVPRSLREGAYGLGSTRFDVSVKIVTPAALSGIVAAFLLAIARAVGETMIVALAAGGAAVLTANPAESVQTMTAYMVQVFLGDASNFGPEYLSAYAVGATLFVMTLVLTLIGGRVLKRFREEYQ